MPTNKSLDSIRTQKKHFLLKKKNTSFFSFFLKRKKTFLSSFLILSLFVGGGFFFFQNTEKIKGATYGWIQSNWGGGQTANTATHTDNQENWTEFSSKDPNIVADADGISISGTSDSWVQTTDGDFGAFPSKEGVYISGGSMIAQKPGGGTCTNSQQCLSLNCTLGVCSDGCGTIRDS
ncbi:MAG: hypothetical protein EOM19_08285 [Candidatus Moranbacteria bacterium]|nr:hypothetical protein [Candidatus Moranbacteria bacterium]